MKVDSVHAYSALKGKDNTPAGVDPSKKEAYLSDAEFKTVFGMDKAEFYKQPGWKITAAKKAKDLF